MFDIGLLTFVDFLLILFSFIVWISFIIFWWDKVFKIYFWLVFGFLLFQVFNTQIELLEVIYFKELWPFQDFLVKNKEFVLGFFTFLIPVFALFATFHNNIILKNPLKKLTIIIFWSFLPFVFIWILAYISVNSYVELTFLRDLLSFLKKSYIFYYLERNTSLIFIAIIFLMLYKIIFSIFLLIFTKIIKNIIKNSKLEEYEDEEEYEEENE